MYSGGGLCNVKKAQYNTKKKTFTYYEKSEQKRAEYKAKVKRVPRNKRIYVDESGVDSYLQREYGRAPRGEKVFDVKRGRKFQRVNIVGALCGEKHLSIECYQRTTTSAIFEEWFKNKLLAKIPRGYTVIMDNASFHRKAELRKLARGKVRLLFLPPYSPDYNRIEKSWANMKRYLRSFLSDLQSVDNAIYHYFNVSDN